MKAPGSRRRGLVILGVVMADLAFNLCLQALVDDFREDRRLEAALSQARAEVVRLQEEIEQMPVEEPAGEGRAFDPPVGEVVVDSNRRVFLGGREIGCLADSPEATVQRLERLLGEFPSGRLRLRLDRRLPVEVYTTIWPAVAGRTLALAVE